MQNIDQILAEQRAFFLSGQTREVSFRRQQLKRLQSAIVTHEAAIFEALKKDLAKSDFEAYASEVGMVLAELKHAIKHLSSWAKPTKVGTVLATFPASGRIHSEPYGVCLILSPWNFPFQLAIAPLIAAIAAGNCCVIKPSEFSSHTTSAIVKLIAETFEPRFVTAVTGEADVGRALTEQPFDLIYFCGAPAIGKLVMQAAAKRLTPVILELGGKNPCIVADDADIPTAARRIIWGKLLNTGQACVSPDFLAADHRIKDELLGALVETIGQFYGDDPATSPDYPRIISDRHFDRLMGLIDSRTLVCGGQSSKSDRYIAPTIIDGVSWSDPLMEEEIFGPILPVITYQDLQEVLTELHALPRPLALYVFSTSRAVQQTVINTLSFGGGCINDTVLHYINPNLPFGGVGQSGIGSYHGRAGFDAFSHRKSILKKAIALDIKLRYPPFKNKLGLLRKLL